ncbi:MAG: c-type cytochrome [Gammaproteobacteria bacterium]|nr:c-type cytochrome [Gammaproteobacteria bacterium]
MKNVLIIAVSLLALLSGNAMADEALAKKSGCFACHAIGKKVVGPAWKDVAGRYKGDAAARDQLIKKVKTGGKGNWTDVTKGVPMPPYSPRVKDEDIATLVDFILGL